MHWKPDKNKTGSKSNTLELTEFEFCMSKSEMFYLIIFFSTSNNFKLLFLFFFFFLPLMGPVNAGLQMFCYYKE